MIIVLFFGGLGWIMEKLEWPRPPVLLGSSSRSAGREPAFPLHRQLRTGLDLAARRSDHLRRDPYRHPLSDHQKETGGQEKAAPEPRLRPLSKRPDRAGCASVRRVALYGLSSSSFLPWRSGRAEISAYRAGLFPWVIGIPTLLLALFQLAKDLWGREETQKPHLDAREAAVDVSPEVASRRTSRSSVGPWVSLLRFGSSVFPTRCPLTMVLYLETRGSREMADNDQS